MLNYIDQDLLSWVEDAFIQTQKYLSETSNFPPFDVYQNLNGDLRFDFALAGYNKDNVDVHFEGDVLTLSSPGVKKDNEDKELRKGIKSSKFSVKYRIADGKFDTQKAEAKFSDGILTITVPIRESQKSRKLNIE